MPQSGTLAALKELFKARRTVTGAGPFTLTPADIGRTILVDNDGGGGAVTVNMPVIPGIPPSAVGVNDGISALGNGAAICIVAVGAGAGDVEIEFPVPIRPAAPPAAAVSDTFNVGQAGPVTLPGRNDWAILVSDGLKTNPGDWLVIQGIA
jgi:hypothetical protein